MRPTIALLLALFTTATFAQDVAFTDVSVFDGRSALEETSVLVEDGVIQEVGADLNLPDGIEIIEGEGRTLLPGLIDSHVHTFMEAALRQNVVFGVTTVLDMFTDPTFAAAMRESQPAAERADLYSAGYLATAPNGHGTQFGLDVPTLTAPDQAREWVANRIAEGSDYIKVVLEDGEALGQELPTLDEATLRAVVREAHERDMLVVTHVQTVESARMAISAGTDGLAHAFLDAVASDEFIESAVDADLFVIPTLSVFQSIGGEPVDETVAEDPRLEPYLSQTDLQNLQSPYSGFESLALENALESVRKLHEAGIPILAGTDAMNPGVVYGASLHRELVLLTRADLPILDALAAATSVPARIFDLEGRGRIAPGLQADLLLVRGDPTVDISDTREIVGVWKRGERVNRGAWRDALASQEQAAGEQAEVLAGSEPLVVSDFEEGEPTAAVGQAWVATTDTQAGGDSQASIEVVGGGPADSDYALRVTGTVGTAFALPWAGAMYMPGSSPFGPADLSSRPMLSFAAMGEPATLRVQLFCQNTGQVPGEWPFEVSEEWQSYEVDLATIADCDVSGVMGIIISAGEPGEFSFEVDEVTLSGRY